jgi:two-component system NtrC family sensor kinase
VVEGRTRAGLRRSVAARVLASYAFMTLAFAAVAGWSIVTQRSSAEETRLVRTGYFPLALAVRDLVAKQDTWNTQLNHITAAKNPADIRVWFDVSLRVGRPRTFEEVKGSIGLAFLVGEDEGLRAVGEVLLREVRDIESFGAGDDARLDRLFAALDHDDPTTAERVRDELVTRGSQVSARLAKLEQSVKRNVELLLDAARERELLAIRLLVGLTVVALCVGLLMALYVRRVLRPVTAITERAQAVARGDLEPRDAVVSDDEIGELAATFERMVAAIARANEQLVVAERLATIGKMAAHVTHEIRNPLSSIALNLELLEEQVPKGDAEAHGLFRAIGKEVERLSALSQQYLSFARRKAPAAELEDVGQIAVEAAEFARLELEKHGVQVKLEIEEELPPVPCDEAQIKQALFNLLRNAREAMPDGGVVTLGVKRDGDQALLITVDDEGKGIDPAARARLFEPFFTTKAGGTGLGLAITQHIAALHGGAISCDPAPNGRGTRFAIRLPIRL